MAASPNDSLQKTVSFTLKFNNKELASTYSVMQIHVWNEAFKISRAKISITGGNSYKNTFEESEQTDFEPGKEVQISIGYDSVNTLVFKGIILKHRVEISEGYLNLASRSLLVLECSDKAIALCNARKSAIFEDKLDSEVISTIAAGASLEKKVDATTVSHPFLTQYDITDWDFLLKRARANGLVVFNTQNALTVTVPKVSGSATLNVKQGDDVTSFTGEVDAYTQLQAVESLSWDTFKETELKQSGSEPSGLDKPGDKVGKTLGKVASPAKLSFGVKAPLGTKELKALADALLVESRFKRVRGEVTFRGVATLKLGSLISLEGFGKTFNGTVYVSSIQHIVKDGNYSTRVGFGLPEGLLRQGLREDANGWMGPVSGLHIGIVKKIDKDPLSQYRIKVMIPSIKSTGEGVWAMLTHFYATSAAGIFFIPELNDEVLVGFLNDDPRYPVVLGSLYNDKHKPKETFVADNSIKSIVTKNKLTMEFNDKDKIITLTTPGKNKIVISDKGKSITIEDQNGNSIVTSASGIEVKSKKNITFDSKAEIKLTSTKAITIKSSSDSVKLDAKDVEVKAKGKFKVTASSGADIKSTGQVNIKGSMVNVN